MGRHGPLADSYVELVAQEAGSAAELAATRKLAKYSALGTQYMTSSQLQSKHWVLYESACEFLNNRGRKIGDNIDRLAFCFNGFLF